MRKLQEVIGLLTIFGALFLFSGPLSFALDSLPIKFNPQDIIMEGAPETFKTSITSRELEPGVTIVTFVMESPTPTVPGETWLKWNTPSVDIQGFWNTNLVPDRVTYYTNRLTSRASSGAPVLAFYNNRDTNRLTIACSDALNKVHMHSYLREEDSRFYVSIGLFDEKTPALNKYTMELRIDTRPLPYYHSLQQVSAWWAAMPEYTPATVPEGARLPMYSTWYSFHQNLVTKEVLNECKIGKKMGLEAVIVDDGWQTMDSQRGYAYTGDWLPVRIPEMKEFVKQVHELDMKFLLWYSLPFIGEKSNNFERFKGKYLRYWDGQGAYVLDPRYPEVRDYIIGTYEKALREWQLDGFKLDFIGFFAAREDTVMTKAQGRDYASVNLAVDRLMTDVMARLKKIKPQIMIEFRQRYIGPLMRKYGNMFRAADCPNMAVVNRVRTVDIRLLAGNTAVHSDMFMWHPDDTVQSAALQILNILHAVPQLSVRLDKVPELHVKMAGFWMDYWRKNRSILLDGVFMPHNPGALYPLIITQKGDKTIAALYGDRVLSLKGSKNLDIVNAKLSGQVILDLEESMGECIIKTFDCMGNSKTMNRKVLSQGLHKLEVPPSGLITIIPAPGIEK